MNFKIAFVFLLLATRMLYAQDESWFAPQVDSLYREDQVYIGVTANFLVNAPSGVNTESIVGGFSLGFIRDMPINKRRNLSIGLGVGYAYNNYWHNLFVGKNSEGQSAIFVLDNTIMFDKNRFETHEIEVPLEFRWRTSTPEEYQFWRIYAGIKLGYTYYFKSVYVDLDQTIKNSMVDEFERLRYTAFLNFGYSAINFQVQYSLNSFFKSDTTIDGSTFSMQPIKLGIIIYLL